MKPFAIFLTFLLGALLGKCTGQYWDRYREAMKRPLRDQISCGNDPSLNGDADVKCLGTYELTPSLIYLLTPVNFTEPHSEYYQALRAENKRNCEGWKPRISACALRFAETSIKLCKGKTDESGKEYDWELASFNLAVAMQNEFCADAGARNLIRFLASGGFKCSENDPAKRNSPIDLFGECSMEAAQTFKNYADLKNWLPAEDGGKKCLLQAAAKCPRRAIRIALGIFNRIVAEMKRIN